MRPNRFNRLGEQLLLSLVVAASLAACTTLDRKNAVPQALTTESYIENMPDVRYKAWSKTGIDKMVADVRAGMKEPGALVNQKQESYLALSGGGDNGAFGAGLLAG